MTTPSCFDQAIADQSLMVADFTPRIVVPITLRFGYASATRSTMALKLSSGSTVRFSSTPSISKPSAAVKSSSLPIITSM